MDGSKSAQCSDVFTQTLPSSQFAPRLHHNPCHLDSSSSEDSDDDQGWVQVPNKKSTSAKRQTPRPTPTTITKSKKILCKNFARGGCGYCNYSSRCQFLHPEDGPLFYFEKAREAHEDEMQQLHAKKRVVYGDPVKELDVEMEILQKVIVWNQQSYKDGTFYDLHYISVKGAEMYVMGIIEGMHQEGIPSVQLIVGRGNHSFDGVPRVKKIVLSQLQGYKGASITVDPSNDGVLIVTI